MDESERPAFLEAYAEDVSNGHVYTLSEQFSDVSAFTLDVDYIGPSVIDSNGALNLISAVCKRLKPFFPSATRAVLCESPPVEKDSGFKTGLHIVYPDLIVDAEGRERLWEDLRQYLMTNPPDGWPEVDWLKAIDSTTGFKPCYSQKVVKCLDCKGVGRVNERRCRGCRGRRRVPDGRWYEPTYIVSDGTVEPFKGTVHEAVVLTSVRRPPDTPVTDGMVKVPTHVRAFTPASAEAITGMGIPQHMRELIVDRGGRLAIDNSAPVVDTIQEYVRTHSVPEHSDIRVLEAAYMTGGDGLYIRVNFTGKSARCCPFADRMHGSSTVKVIMTRYNWHLSCWSEKHCRGKSMDLRVNDDLRRELFSERLVVKRRRINEKLL